MTALVKADTNAYIPTEARRQGGSGSPPMGGGWGGGKLHLKAGGRAPLAPPPWESMEWNDFRGIIILVEGIAKSISIQEFTSPWCKIFMVWVDSFQD